MTKKKRYPTQAEWLAGADLDDGRDDGGGAGLEQALARVAELEAAMAMAIKQNECDMLLTGDELRQCRAALKGTP